MKSLLKMLFCLLASFAAAVASIGLVLALAKEYIADEELRLLVLLILFLAIPVLALRGITKFYKEIDK